jgi:hypothetical protein
LVAVTLAAAAAALPSSALAGQGNPNGTGQPSQSCQSLESTNSLPSQQAGASPGSPFNEPTPTSAGGTGGQNYSPSSQYDVACYQTSQH